MLIKRTYCEHRQDHGSWGPPHLSCSTNNIIKLNIVLYRYNVSEMYCMYTVYIKTSNGFWRSQKQKQKLQNMNEKIFLNQLWYK